MLPYVRLFIVLIILILCPLQSYATSPQGNDRGLVSVSDLNTEQEAFRDPLQSQLDTTETPKRRSLASSLNEFPLDIRSIKERGTLRVGMFNKDRIPFFMQDEDGKLVGLDPDIARGIAHELGVEAEFIRTETYGEAVKCVVDKKCDIAISKLSLTMDRAQKVLYTGWYVRASKVLLVNRLALQKLKKRSDESLEDLMKTGQFIVAVSRDSSYEAFAKELFPQAQIKTYDSFDNEAIPHLLKGSYTAIFSDEMEVYNVLQSLPGASFKLMAIKLKDQYDPLYMVVQSSSPNLLHFIQRYMEAKNIQMSAEEARQSKKYESFIQWSLERDKKRWKEILTQFDITIK